MPTSSSASQARPPQLVASVVPLVAAWRVDRAFDYAAGSSDVTIGSLVRVTFGGRKVRGFVVALEERAPDRDLEEIAAVVTPTPLLPPSMRELYEWLAERYVTPRGKAFARAVPPRVRVTPDPVMATVTAGDAAMGSYDRGAELLAHLRAGLGGIHCIQVVPGTDRGELIADLVAAASGPALIAVPEVRYGSLVIDALSRRIDGLVRVDSSIGDAERARGWLRFAAGSTAAVGGRGAVLAPSRDLALIVVDEEHHHTYKEDRAPRYHAVRAAAERARIQSASCVLVSATPSVESAWTTMSSNGHWVTATRSQRRSARPVIELVTRPDDRSLSPELHARVRDRLRAGERVALLAPSGAYARAVWCASCRRSLRCPECEAGVFYDRAPGIVRCVRCNHRAAAPDRCPSCGADDFRFVGAGTERLGDQLAKSFPHARVVRVDPSDPAEVPSDVDVYVTTWAGTKRELRPQVSLVGVLDADWLLRRPDFRAAESGYQALVEMAEWAGPAQGGGHLVIQTADPGHHAIQAVVRADYSFFYERELAVRRELAYPPFSELIRLSATGGDEALRALRAVVDGVARDGVTVLGPVRRSAPPRAEALLKCRSAIEVARDLRAILSSKRTAVMVDVDPR